MSWGLLGIAVGLVAVLLLVEACAIMLDNMNDDDAP